MEELEQAIEKTKRQEKLRIRQHPVELYKYGEQKLREMLLQLFQNTKGLRTRISHKYLQERIQK